MFKRAISVSPKICIFLTSAALLITLDENAVKDNLDDAHNVTKLFLVYSQL